MKCLTHEEIVKKYHSSNYFHPSVSIAEGVEIGERNYFGPGCIIGAPAEHKTGWNPDDVGRVSIGDDNVFTGLVTIDSGRVPGQNTVVRDNCMFMKHAHVGHDAVISKDCTLSVGAIIGGHAWLDDSVNVGCGAFIHQRQVIAPYCMIGAGAVVAKHLETEAFKIYAGVPAIFKAINEAKESLFSPAGRIVIKRNFDQNKHVYAAHTAQ